MKLVYAVVLPAVLIGCATPEQKAQRYLEVYGPVCDKLGFEKNTDNWRNCVLGQANARNSRPAYTPPKSTMTCTTTGATTQCY